MLTKRIVAIGMAILNILVTILAIIKLRALIEVVWAHQGDNRLLITGSIIILSVLIIGAVFNLLVLGLMPWLKNYQHLKIVGIATSGILVLSTVELIILGAKIGKLI